MDSFSPQPHTNKQLYLETCLSSPAVGSQFPGEYCFTAVEQLGWKHMVYTQNPSVNTERQESDRLLRLRVRLLVAETSLF